MKIGDQYWYRISGSNQWYYHRIEIVEVDINNVFGDRVVAKFLDDGRVQRIYAALERLLPVSPLEALAECADGVKPRTLKIVPYR